MPRKHAKNMHENADMNSTVSSTCLQKRRVNLDTIPSAPALVFRDPRKEYPFDAHSMDVQWMSIEYSMNVRWTCNGYSIEIRSAFDVHSKPVRWAFDDGRTSRPAMKPLVRGA
jgi:hypothetical protein